MARTPDPSEAEFVRRVREPRAATVEPGRQRARRSAMMVLYRSDLVGGDLEAAIGGFESEHGFELPPYGATIVRGVASRLTELDAELEERLEGWTLDRLGSVERSVLRAGLWELVSESVPGPVAIDEAVELAKRYATPEAAKLVNGVLAAWLRDHDGREVDARDEEE